jgi:hypothetical protein
MEIYFIFFFKSHNVNAWTQVNEKFIIMQM